MTEEIFTQYWDELKTMNKSELTRISHDEKEPLIKRTIAKAMMLFYVTGEFHHIEKVLGMKQNPYDLMNITEIVESAGGNKISKKKAAKKKAVKKLPL
ncbi:MAG: hypothetical protein H7A25_04215 [Leptospiraceae bacterium]|nr:hypothetical protein [Leptospiraceae bacterium]MCP5499081.1 hypothetical protein [Leptospiraceae bacterium]